MDPDYGGNWSESRGQKMLCSLKGLIVLESRSDWNCIKSDSCLMKINIIGIIAGFPWTFCKSEPTRHSVFSCSSCNSNILQWWSCILYSIFSELWEWKCVCWLFPWHLVKFIFYCAWEKKFLFRENYQISLKFRSYEVS